MILIVKKTHKNMKFKENSQKWCLKGAAILDVVYKDLTINSLLY